VIHSNGLRALNQNGYRGRSVNIQGRIADVIAIACRISREHVRVIAKGRIFWGTPAFIEFEHKGPVHQRLGPGLSRESDSFWPISEW
jgi:hypothetical protein